MEDMSSPLSKRAAADIPTARVIRYNSAKKLLPTPTKPLSIENSSAAVNTRASLGLRPACEHEQSPTAETKLSVQLDAVVSADAVSPVYKETGRHLVKPTSSSRILSPASNSAFVLSTLYSKSPSETIGSAGYGDLSQS
jgi:predicted transcriptional regulator